MITTTTRSILALAAMLVLSATHADAAPGDLDTSFSGDGILVQPVGSFGSQARAVLVQDDAKLVVVGEYESGGDAIAVLRYHPDGSLDTSFAGDGIQTTSIGPSHDTPYAAALQDDGKIVVAGETDNGGNSDVAVLRYNTDGSLDTSFSGDGIQTTDFAAIDFAVSVAIQSDGKIVLAGGSGAGIGGFDFAVARYNTDGSLDTTFSGDGKLTTTFGFSVESAGGVAIQDDGRIVVAGLAGSSFAVARYDTDGTLDTTFSGDGKQTTFIGGTGGFANAVRIQSDGKIVAAGVNDNDIAVVRYDTNGILDASFWGSGIRTIAISAFTDVVYGLAIQSNGRIVLGGSTDGAFAVARLEENGALDTSFSGDGIQTTTVGVSDEGARSLAIQADGRIVTAGWANYDPDYGFAIVRYRGDECGDGLVELGEVCDDGNVLAGDCCSATCAAMEALDTPCGSSADTICDNPDTCDATGICLTNHETGGPIVCRSAVGECDVEDQCAAGVCPADDFVAVDTPCGDSNETICDKPDTCDGAGACAANLEPGSTPCRGAVDACDVTEHCAAGDCPADGFAAVATACGDPGDSVCDNADSCDGFGTCLANYEPASTACDADSNECTHDRCDGDGACAHPFNSEPCDDGLVCTSDDTCAGGVCVGGAPPACDDADPCTQDKCDDTEGCYNVVEPRPVSSCLVAPKTALKIQRDVDPSQNKLQWKWTAGEAFVYEDLGNPYSDSYALCLYDTTASVPSLAMRIDIAPGASWKSKTLEDWQYKDKERSSDGVQKVQLRPGEAGRAKASLKADGANLPLITTPDENSMFAQEPALVAQLVSPGGICLTSSFDAESTKQNDTVRFQARTKP